MCQNIIGFLLGATTYALKCRKVHTLQWNLIWKSIPRNVFSLLWIHLECMLFLVTMQVCVLHVVYVCEDK